MLDVGSTLLALASAPALLLGVVAAALPAGRWLPVTGPWPRLPPGPLGGAGYRLLGAAVVLGVAAHLVLVLLGRRRRWARTAGTALVTLAGCAAVMLLLADLPRLGWMLGGGAAVLCALAGTALVHQPPVDRYLAHPRRTAADPDAGAAVPCAGPAEPGAGPCAGAAEPGAGSRDRAEAAELPPGERRVRRPGGLPEPRPGDAGTTALPSVGDRR